MKNAKLLLLLGVILSPLVSIAQAEKAVPSLYVGANVWSGNLPIRDATKYEQFLKDNDLQTDNSTLLKLQISTTYGRNCGFLPGKVPLVISPYVGVQPSSKSFGKLADGYFNDSLNGFKLDYKNQLQIKSQFTDSSQQTMNVEVLFEGSMIAWGVIPVDSNYLAQRKAGLLGPCQDNYPGIQP
jgi:hypothetical protein